MTTIPEAEFLGVITSMEEAHRLMPPKIQETMPALHATESLPADQKMARVKLFTPWANWTWYLVEYEAEDRIAFGLVHGHEKELGCFSLAELEAIRGPGGLRIERDLAFSPSLLIDL